MKITDFALSNFRCFKAFEATLEDDVTIFVAANGGGKTTVLDGIAMAFCPIAAISRQSVYDFALREYEEIGDTRFDSLLQYRDFGGTQKSDTVESIVTLSGGRFEGTTLAASAYNRLSADPDESTSLSVEIDDVRRYKELFFPPNEKYYPVFAYYRATRYVTTVPDAVPVEEEDLGRLVCWEGSWNAATDFDSTVDWLRAKEEQELRLGREKKDWKFRLPNLDAIRGAASVVLDSISDFYFSSATIPKLNVKQIDSNGNEVERMVSQLGAGHRNMFALVVDFARRMAQTNPHLENPLEAEAVLVIDEIDLHLHPAWQQRILGDLRKAFPNTQIITSTHSPQVLTSVESRCVRILEEGELKSTPAALDGAESSRALESVFGTPTRPPGERTDQLTKLSRLISKKKFEEAEALLDELKKWSQGEEPYLIEAEDEIENQKWLNAG